MSSFIVSSGQVSSGLVVTYPEMLFVQGGTVIATTVDSGGNLYVTDGGIASGTIVASGGADFLYAVSGDGVGTGIDATIENGGREYVYSGGIASGTDLQSGALQYVNSSGIAAGTIVESGAVQLATDLGIASGSIVEAGGSLLLNFASSFDAVLSGGTETVGFQASASSTVIGAGAIQAVESGGTARGTHILSGGRLLVLSGADISGTNVDAGGAVVSTGTALFTTPLPGFGDRLAAYGASLSGTVLGVGDTEYVLSGRAEQTTVGRGGRLIVSSGGVASASVVLSGGQVQVTSAGLLSGGAVDAFGQVFVQSGGVTSALVLSSVAFTLFSEQVVQGGRAADTTVLSAASLLLEGGSATGTVVSSGGRLENLGSAMGSFVGAYGSDEVSGIETGATIGSAGSQTVSAGGLASATLLEAGGTQYVFGTAEATTIDSGAAEIVLTAGVASGSVLEQGGIMVVQGGYIFTSLGSSLAQGKSVATVLSGGIATIGSQGLSVDMQVGSGAIELLDSGGVASGTHVLSGGRLLLLGGAQASGTVVDAGGQVLSTGAFLFSAGGNLPYEQLVSYGPVLSGVSVTGSSREYVIGGTALDTYVASGGEQFLSAGSVASATVVGNRGLTEVSSGAVLSDATVSLGGLIEVGGIASGVILAGGQVFVDQGGRAVGGSVGAGGLETVIGTAIGTTIGGGGTLQLLGGTASGVVVSGGAELVEASDRGALVEAGGVQSVEGGNVISALIAAGGVQSTYGGSVSATRIGFGGAGIYQNTHVSGEVITSGGLAALEAGAVLSGAVVSSGGVLVVLQGATTSGVAVSSGAIVVSGGAVVITPAGGARTGRVLSGAVLGQGGVGYAFAGGTLAGTVVSLGSFAVLSGGVASASLLQALGPNGSAAETISSGGLDMGATVLAGAEQDIAFSGAASGAVLSGGVQEVRGSATATLVMDGGVQFVSGTASGTVLVNGGIQDVTGSAFGTVISSGGVQSAFGTVYGTTILSGGLSEVVRYASGAEIFSGGAMEVSGTYASVFGAVVNLGGVLNLERGAFSEATVINSGGVEFVAGGVTGTFGPNYNGPGFADGTVINSGGEQILGSAGAGGAFQYPAPGGSTNIHLVEGGMLDLAYQGYDATLQAELNAATDVLTISESGVPVHTLQFAGDYTGEYFHLADDGAGDVLVAVDGTPCYCRGTLIATAAGDIAVEDLRIGDLLVTASGAARPLRWIGRRSYDGRFAAGNTDVLPVVFRAGCLSEGVPRRDLWVSPLHAMFLDGVLIPAWCLVNGANVVQVEAVERVAYFHLELDSHDVLLAEGAASESYLEDDNRLMFHNAAEYAALYPDTVRRPALYCAPRLEDGEIVERVRRRLAGGAAAIPLSALAGWLDSADRRQVIGWARDGGASPVRLVVLDHGAAIGEVTADLPRADVQAALGGGLCCGFAFEIAGGLSPDLPHLITVQRRQDAAELPGGAREIAVCDPQAESVGDALRGNIDRADRERVLGWAWEGAAPVALHLFDNGRPVGRVLANRWRGDVAEAAIGDGRHAFEFVFPVPLAPEIAHQIMVRRESDGALLPGSPVVIEAADRFDAGLQGAVARAVAALGSGASVPDRRQAMRFMLDQAAMLARQEADTAAARDDRQWARHVGTDRPDPGMRALVIDALPPMPDRDAGSQALLSHMRALRELGYAVSFVAAEGMADSSAVLDEHGVAVCGAPFYASVEDVLRRQAGCFDVVYLHRAAIAEAYMALVRRWMPRARVLYALADLHHLRLARQAAVEQRPELLAEARRWRLAECNAAWHADAVLTHSSHEAALLRQAVPRANVHVVPWQVNAHPGPASFAARRGVAFIGNYGHAPNIDAARFLGEVVMKLVWQQDPTLPCVLAGHAMPQVVRNLAGPALTMRGHVPDITALLGEMRVTVAPLRFGAGVKGKVLDSLAAGVPCVMTELAAEGMALPDPLRALVADDAAGLAARILDMHSNANARLQVAAAGLAYIERAHGGLLVRDRLAAAIAQRAVAAA